MDPSHQGKTVTIGTKGRHTSRGFVRWEVIPGVKEPLCSIWEQESRHGHNKSKVRLDFIRTLATTQPLITGYTCHPLASLRRFQAQGWESMDSPSHEEAVPSSLKRISLSVSPYPANSFFDKVPKESLNRAHKNYFIGFNASSKSAFLVRFFTKDSCVKELLLGIKTDPKQPNKARQEQYIFLQQGWVSEIRICTLFSSLTHKLLPGQEEDKNNHLLQKGIFSYHPLFLLLGWPSLLLLSLDLANHNPYLLLLFPAECYLLPIFPSATLPLYFTTLLGYSLLLITPIFTNTYFPSFNFPTEELH